MSQTTATTMSKQVKQNLESISADTWQQFTDGLAQASDSIFNEFGATNARERAEGLRYLSRLISIGLDMHLEHADSAHPTFTRVITDTRKFIGDNPDAEYDYARLDSSREYRIWGNRGISDYLAFCVYAKDAEGAISVDANINDVDIQFEEDGAFEIFLSRENQRNARNWLQLSEDADSVLVRQYFTGGRSQRGTYQIETLTSTASPALTNEAFMREKLLDVARFVRETSAMSAAVSIYASLNTISSDNLLEGESHHSLELVDGELKADERPSSQELAAKIDPKVISGHMPTPDIQYSGGWWSLKPGEAVVIEGDPLKCRYWSLQIFTRWMESPDYRYFKVQTNSAEVEYEADGSFVVVLAPENKGFKNWIGTNGWNEGQICFRALLAEDDPEVSYRIERIANLIAEPA